MAVLIEQSLGVHFNGDYPVERLRAREHAQQKPDQLEWGLDEVTIARWREEDWPRLQKKPGRKGSAGPVTAPPVAVESPPRNQ